MISAKPQFLVQFPSHVLPGSHGKIPFGIGCPLFGHHHCSSPSGLLAGGASFVSFKGVAFAFDLASILKMVV